MTSNPRDPLLNAAKVVVVLAQIVMIFGIVMLGIGIGALLTVGRAELAAEIAKAGAPPLSAWVVVAAMLVGATLLFLGWHFLKELLGIINSVGDGDPFRPDNADRLSRMGWIAVIAQLVVLPLAGIATWLSPYLDKVDRHMQIDGGLDGGSILLTLVLFILARVFREGARMREELEGTV
ncbi:DUF2975 domain-containing protein [Novosphingobium ginsenosidimutans]|uniref:DUF2975 domain-containing protein n=1 Tax=Novosphingobium ginsenosidimutans TaxID=1176536 RepID=A0A5B8S490_9SPHN|nr:DUF2975 domain-containing protein [Novosphingobium ginsenosidimutans]QEA15964.1 DUF2975 domain-containing protein [Novosphingobium ginsenosidimutans]